MARKAVDLKAEVRVSWGWAIAVAFITFVLAASLLWLSRWIQASWSHWLILLAGPTAAAVVVTLLLTGGIRSHLRMQEDVLETIRERSPRSEEGQAADDALSMISADQRGSLVPRLVLWSAVPSAVMAVVLLAGVWYWTNKRVVKSR